MTLPLGLGIGKIVFGTLTKIEMLFAGLIIIALVIGKQPKSYWRIIAIPVFIVIIDNFLLLPALDQRADMIINGLIPEPSNMHWWYVILELLKLLSLLLSGALLLSKNITSSSSS